MIQPLDACILNPQHERACTRVFRAHADGLQERWIIRGDDDGDDECAEDIEDHQTPDEPPRCLRDIMSRRLALPCRNGDKFRAQHERKARSDQCGPEGQELPQRTEMWSRVALKSSWWSRPVMEIERMVLVRPTAKEEHCAEEGESEDGDDFQTGEPEL